MDISLVQGSSTLLLNGSGVSAPLKAARFVNEDLSEIEAVCEGTAAQIASVSDSIGSKLYEAARSYGLAGENWVFVQYTLPDGGTWRSPIRGGTMRSVHGPAGRKRGSQTISILLDRAEYWEKAASQYTAISNIHGSSSDGILVTVYNHSDAGHNSFLDLAASEGDLPAPATIQVVKASQPNVEMYLGLGSFLDRPNVNLFLEAESGGSGTGVTPANTANTAASGGNYTALAWSGSAEMTLRYWTLTAAATSALAGRIFRPVARLFSLIGGSEKMWARLVVQFDNGSSLETVYSGDYVQIPTDKLMLVFPAVQLPPWQVQNATSQSISISIRVYEEGGGSNTLNLDFLHLLPLDSSLHLLPMLTTYPNTALTYDSGTGLMLADGKSMLTHLAEGPGLWLVPGRLGRLLFVFRVTNTWDIGLNFGVNISYRPRKRNL